VKLYETSKPELLDLWHKVLKKNDIIVKENSKVEAITSVNEHFQVETLSGEKYSDRNVLLAIGRRGTPRKLDIPGESMEKVAYRLLEPELIQGKNIVVVGGGDSAIESALLLTGNNKVILSYRNEAFSRIKPKNLEKISAAANDGTVEVRFNTNLVAIDKETITIASVTNKEEEPQRIKNDLVYIFAGGELPTQFLMKVGLKITKKFGEAILKHR